METNDQVTLLQGNCLEVLKTLADDSVDAIVTDPPYGLEFMGREWDTFKPSNAKFRSPSARDIERGIEQDGLTTRIKDGKPEAYVAGLPFQAWCQAWATECLRVLKPGGYLLAFGGTRTYHRLVCGIEDAGFEIRDSIHWVQSAGFPKSLDVGKAIDRALGAEREIIGTAQGAATQQTHSLGPFSSEYPATTPTTDEAKQWAGFGTALKPSHEAIVVARKPLIGTVANNVLTHGTGALNIEGCRVATEDNLNGGAYGSQVRKRDQYTSTDREVGAAPLSRLNQAFDEYRHPGGRWPSNLVLSHLPDCGEDCAPGCAVAEMDRQSGYTVSQGGNHSGRIGTRETVGDFGYDRVGITRPTDSGGGSRFFPVFRYEPKAPASERLLPDGTRSIHPTMKPLDLMRWLVRLVTPPGGLCLDPFAGSGTTLVAAQMEGMRAIGIEMSEEYCEIARKRLGRVQHGIAWGVEE